MNEYDVKRLALILAIQSEIEAMKVRNDLSILNQCPPYYSSDHFDGKATELRELAKLSNSEITLLT
jgi:hypothetical protein